MSVTLDMFKNVSEDDIKSITIKTEEEMTKTFERDDWGGFKDVMFRWVSSEMNSSLGYTKINPNITEYNTEVMYSNAKNGYRHHYKTWSKVELKDGRVLSDNLPTKSKKKKKSRAKSTHILKLKAVPETCLCNGCYFQGTCKDASITGVRAIKGEVRDCKRDSIIYKEETSTTALGNIVSLTVPVTFKDSILRADSCIPCDTEEKARNLLKWLSSKGYKWRSGESLDITFWSRYEAETHYFIDTDEKKLSYGYEPCEYNVIKYEDALESTSDRITIGSGVAPFIFDMPDARTYAYRGIVRVDTGEPSHIGEDYIVRQNSRGVSSYIGSSILSKKSKVLEPLPIMSKKKKLVGLN